MIHINIRSSNANGDKLVSYLSTLKQSFDVIWLTKTWSDDQSIDFSDLLLQYIPLGSNRSNRRGGESAVFVKRHLNRSMILDLTQNLNYVESVFVKVLLQSKLFIVGSVYRPPNSEMEPFIIN